MYEQAGIRIAVKRARIPRPGEFDIHDIDTTVRTLQAITKRAADEASASAE